MKSLSFVIPFRDKGSIRRKQILEWNIRRLDKLFPAAEVLVSSDNGAGAFNRSQACNNGVRMATGDVVCIVDSDTVFNSHTVTAGLKALKSSPWVIPYGTYYRTDKVSGDNLLYAKPNTPIAQYMLTYTHVFDFPPTKYEEAVSGLIMVPREDYLYMGGFNEDFTGWGYEDRGFVRAADVILGGHGRCLEGEVFHIWHEEPAETTWQNPALQNNKELYEKMCTITDPDEMREINANLSTTGN